MASGYGELSSYTISRLLARLTEQFDKAYLVQSSNNAVMSDTISLNWDGVGSTDQEVSLSSTSSPFVFTISQAGTVDTLYSVDSSNTLRAVIDLTPVVYGTPTFYTLVSLTIQMS